MIELFERIIEHFIKLSPTRDQVLGIVSSCSTTVGTCTGGNVEDPIFPFFFFKLKVFINIFDFPYLLYRYRIFITVFIYLFLI